MTMTTKKWSTRLAAGAVALLGAVSGFQSTANATNAGDYQAGGTPAGTFFFLDYAGYTNADTFVTPGKPDVDANLDQFTNLARFVYFFNVFGLSANIQYIQPAVRVDNVRVGAGPTGKANVGFADPIFLATIWGIADAKNERWIGFSPYAFVPWGKKSLSNNRLDFEAEIGYTEGLAKFGLKGFYFDMYNAAIVHGDDNAFSKDTTYETDAYLRYNYSALGHVAVGFAKVWGGDNNVNNLYAGTNDERLTGRLEVAFEMSPLDQLDILMSHDFEAQNGFQNDFGITARYLHVFPAPAKIDAPFK